jgi:hypothetical protein
MLTETNDDDICSVGKKSKKKSRAEYAIDSLYGDEAR